MKSTKHSIYTSLISLLLCISMLMGTTFAWFTDLVSSNGNVIQTGNLDAQMFWSDEFISADADGWRDAENQAVFTHNNWEPGYTDLKYVKIHNGGSLNLKWKLTVEADGPVTELADVIDVYYVNPATNEITTLVGLESVGTLTEVMSEKTNNTGSLIPGQSAILAIAFHMQEDAGNKYQNLSLCTNGFSLKLIATQETGEFDSFGDNYDNEADWDEGTKNFSASAPLSQVPIIYGALASGITIGGANGVSASIPAKVKVADDATSLDLAVKTVNIDNNLTLNEGEFAKSMDVHIEGVAYNNTVPMTVNLGAILAPGLSDTEVKLYHNENGNAIQMTRVANAADFATHNQFTYNPETGEVSIHVATFSVFSAIKTNADVWDGTSDTSWYNTSAIEFTLSTAEQFAGFRDLVDGGNTFEGKTVKLGADIDLANIQFDPIGFGYAHKGGQVFMGTFDGQKHTVYNLNQNCWLLDPDKTNYSTYTYSTAGAGLFASVMNSTIKNIAISGAEIVFECVDMGVLVGYAQGTCHFENIIITNSKIGNYNRYTGGVVGEVSFGPYGTDTSLGYSHTFKNITVDSTVKVCGLWGSFGCGMGGVIGGKWNDATVYMENVISAPVMDVYNDVVSAYQWYAFRGCGMLIGHTEEPYSDGRTSGNATASFLTCKNVKVYYGDWVNYHYYEFANQDSGTGRSYPWVRAEAGEYCEAFSNIRYGVPTHNGVKVSDLTEEELKKVATNYTPIVFNQLYGADRGMYGTAEHPGVTVYDTNFKTIYVKNNKGWTNLKLHYAYVNGEDRWTTAVEGTTLQKVTGTDDLYIVNIPSYADRFMITADGDNATRECYSNQVEADRTYTLDFWHDHTPVAEIVGSFVRYRCTTCGDVFKTSDYDADYLYDGTNTEFNFAANGASKVTIEDGKYNVMFKPEVETAPEAASKGWATNSNDGKLGSQPMLWIPGRANGSGFDGFSCENNSMGVISFKMKTNMTNAFILSVAKERDAKDWTGWGTSEIKLLSIGGYSDNGIVLKGGIGAGTTLTTIPAKDGWSEEFEVDIYIKLTSDNKISLTYYINGVKCGSEFTGNMTIDSHDIRAIYINGWTYAANTGFIFDDISIKYTDADYTYTGSNQDAPYYYHTNNGGIANLTTTDNNYSVISNSNTSTHHQFWFPSNANGKGFNGFSCERNSLGAISFKISSSISKALTLSAAKERNSSNWTPTADGSWGSVNAIDIFSIAGISDGATSVTLTGGIGANKHLTDVKVTNGVTEDIDVIIFIKLKDDNTITLSYYINGKHCGTFSGDMTIDTYDIRAFYLNGWTYAADTGFVFDDLAIAYANNGHFEYNYGLRAVPGIEGRYESICTCCGTIYGYVDNLYHLTYEDCGAAGNGVSDDSEAIRRTHEMANYAGLPVIASSSTRTYYIGKITETITIKTDTDWNGAKFILDDRQIHWRDSARSLDVFTVASDTPATSLPVPTGLALTKGQTNIGMTFAEPCMILIENSDEKIYKRYGANANGGVTKQELILVDADGNVDLSTPIQYNYAQVTKITMYSIDDTPLRVGNATVTTVAPNPKDPNNPYYDPNFQNSNDNGYFRGLSVKRSNTTIYDVEHIVENEMMTVELDRDGNGTIDKWGDGDKSYGVTYYGFFNFVKCYNVTLQDCIVEGHQAYSFMDTYTDTNGTVQSTRNETGSYDIKAEYCIDITFDNIDQYENAATGEVITNRFMYHGIMGSNWCRNMVMNDCYIDRFDAHQGMHNATITNSTLGFGILVIGGGTLYVGNTYSHAVQGFIHLRTDYNSIFDGDVIIKDCTIGNSENSNSLIIGNWLKHDAGLPNNMINNLVINGLTIDNNSNSISIFNIANAAKSALTDTTNPLILPESIVVTGVKHSNGSYVNVKASKYSGDAFADYNISTDLNSVCNGEHKNFVFSYDNESGEPASYTCTRCGYSYTLNGGMLDQSDIKNGVTDKSHTFDTSNGYLAMINNGTSNGQHQIWVPGPTMDPDFVDFACENNSVGFLSFKISAKDTHNTGISFQVNTNRDGYSWINGGSWSASFLVVFKIHPNRDGADSVAISGLGGQTITTVPVNDTGWTDDIDVVILLKLKSDKTISAEYYINGLFTKSISSVSMPSAMPNITSLYVAGRTNTAGEGYILDDLIFGYTNNTSVTDEDIVVNYVANNNINDTLLGFAGTSTGTVILPTVTRNGYRFLGWYTAASGGTKIGDAGATYKPNGDVKIYAQWQGYTVTYDANSGSVSPSSTTVSSADGYVTLPTPTRNNYTFNGWYTARSGGTKVGNAGENYTPTADVTLYAQWTRECVTGDTLVTLSDGSQKRIDEVTYEDNLLVWDFFSGTYTSAPSSIIFRHGYDNYRVLTLNFENNTVVKVIENHGFYHMERNGFVFIDESNVESFIGESFVIVNGSEYSSIKLVGYSVSEEYTASYSIQTAQHNNFVVAGLFSITKPYYEGWFDYFEIGEDMKYDEEKMQADIDTYGLYTYEDFADYVTYEQFIAFNGPYLKVLVGRGVVTYEQIIELIKMFVK